jgi:hypothetical protein
MNTPSDTRQRAIAIRQPFAWAVVHAGKDVENRPETAIRAYRPAVGHRVMIHASKGMTRVEYERAVDFMASIGVRCPAPDELPFGGVIGSVLVIDIVMSGRIWTPPDCKRVWQTLVQGSQLLTYIRLPYAA